MKTDIYVMCTFSKGEFAEYLLNKSKTCFLVVNELLKNHMDINDIMQELFNAEGAIPILQIDKYIIKYLPLFFSDFSIPLDTIKNIIDIINNEIVTYNEEDFDFYFDIVNEIEERWFE